MTVVVVEADHCCCSRANSVLRRRSLGCIASPMTGSFCLPPKSPLPPLGSGWRLRLGLLPRGRPGRSARPGSGEHRVQMAVLVEGNVIFAATDAGRIWRIVMGQKPAISVLPIHEPGLEDCAAMVHARGALYLFCRKLWKVDLASLAVSEFAVLDRKWDTASAAIVVDNYIYVAARNFWRINLADPREAIALIPFNKLLPISTSWESCNGLVSYGGYLFAFCRGLHRIDPKTGAHEPFLADDGNWSGALSVAHIGHYAFVATSARRLWRIDLDPDPSAKKLKTKEAVVLQKSSTQWTDSCVLLALPEAAPARDVGISGISLSASDQKRISSDLAVLQTTVDILLRIHATLRAAFVRDITLRSIPLLLVDSPSTLLEVKTNIDKYLQFGFLHSSDKLYQLWAYQYLSDYCVGLALSPAQMNDFFRAERPHAKNIAMMIWVFCKKYDVARTPVAALLQICAAHRGGGNIDDDFKP